MILLKIIKKLYMREKIASQANNPTCSASWKRKDVNTFLSLVHIAHNGVPSIAWKRHGNNLCPANILSWHLCFSQNLECVPHVSLRGTFSWHPITGHRKISSACVLQYLPSINIFIDVHFGYWQITHDGQLISCSFCDFKQFRHTPVKTSHCIWFSSSHLLWLILHPSSGVKINPQPRQLIFWHNAIVSQQITLNTFQLKDNQISL